MVVVAGGESAMGCSPGAADFACPQDELPLHIVELHEFFIDRTEVTVAAYSECVKAHRCPLPAREEGCNFEAVANSHPVNCVTWDEAKSYCAWRSKRLPTEAEWEKAARGIDRSPATYPWGDDEPSCALTVMDDGAKGCGSGGTMPAGTRPAGASPFGAHDMSGNVWEWVADRYLADYYADSPKRAPTGPEPGPFAGDRVRRGGGWINALAQHLTVSVRGHASPDRMNVHTGFRCARDGQSLLDPED